MSDLAVLLCHNLKIDKLGVMRPSPLTLAWNTILVPKAITSIESASSSLNKLLEAFTDQKEEVSNGKDQFSQYNKILSQLKKKPISGNQEAQLLPSSV